MAADRSGALDALLAAAEDGVDCDGLSVAREADGYAFRTPDVERSGLSEAELRAVAADAADYVTNWLFWTDTSAAGGRGRPGREWLRWIERAGDRSVPERYEALRAGVERSWGELSITATLADGTTGERRYDLRHADDAGADAADLEERSEPRAARDLVTFDERGRYRPLKTAPTLRSGWAFSDLPAGGLLSAVDLIYPATVANWARERAGNLDVDHWAETAERQTGIYDVVGELRREAVEWVAEACCVDSECLKRREWEYDEGDELDADPGDGAFPCREPCSLVIAAARTWTMMEDEESRSYEFELTPAEKEQIEAIIDAVADGRVDEIREADVSEGANRYRARYLRAKRFDGEGNLSGTPTE